jgi:TolB-like protein
MSAADGRTQWIRFGVYEVNAEERTMLRKGVKLRLQDKPFAVLSLLLESPGQLVDREELRRKLWPAGTYVDFEHGLSVAIHKLRTALDDDAESPRYIETVPGHGYRFIVPIVKPQPNARAEARSLLVVLPFVGLASGSEMDHIADGFTEELTAQLSKAMTRRLGVIGRTTAMCYKGANKSIAAIGNEIDVDYVLEGSVRGQNGLLRLTVRLIRVSDQSHVWTESLQGDSSNPIHTQITLSDQVTRALATYLFPGESPLHKISSNHRPKRRSA